MKTEVIVQGFPGKRACGSLSWSSVALIDTGDHKILVDTGGPGVRATIRQHVKNAGVQPEEIDMLIITHFHDDHVRNFDYFPNARIFLHEIDANWALTEPEDFAVPVNLFPALQKTGRLELIKQDGELIPGIETMLVPGHTPGSIAVIVKAPGKPVTVITGDAVKNMDELATGNVSHSKNPAVSANSIKKIRDLAQIVVPGHDRILQVAEDEIIALTAARQTIIVPQGVVDEAGPRYLEMTLEQTARKKEPILA